MIDREQVLAVLWNRFHGAAADQIAAAANAIVGLPDEWEEVTLSEPNDGNLAENLRRGGELKIFKKRNLESR